MRPPVAPAMTTLTIVLFDRFRFDGVDDDDDERTWDYRSVAS